MRFQQFVAIACIVWPISLLLCMGCGIILLPVEVPKILVANAQTIQFHVNIHDGEGHPLDDVKVDITPASLEFNPLFGDDIKTKPYTTQMVNGSFDYKTSGNFAVWVDFSKPGYIPVYRLYSNQDHLPHNWAVVVPHEVNVKKQPASEVVLLSSSPATTSRGVQH